MGFLENFWNRTHISDHVSDDPDATRHTNKRSLFSYLRNFSKRLQGMGKRRISRALDEEIQGDVSRTDKIREMTKTREEDFSSSVFEWVKTENQGTTCRFKEFVVENGIEYTVFSDGSRIDTRLIGDIVLKHDNVSQVLGGHDLSPAKLTGNPDEPYEFPLITDVKPPSFNTAPKRIEEGLPVAEVSVSPGIQQNSSPAISTPVLSILEKAKKKKQKVSIELTVELPSAEILSIIRENFSGSDEDLYNFFIQKVDKKKFVSAIIQAVSNK